MTKIKYDAATPPHAVLDAVRRSLTSRDYHWEPEGELSALASEGGPAGNRAISHALQLTAEVQPSKQQVVLRQRTHGAAYAANGAAFVTVKLNLRFAKIVKAVREDLAAGTR